MQDPSVMKNKGEVITAINAAQTHFGEKPSAISPNVNRPALEAMLLAYVTRYRATATDAGKGFETIECPACEGSGKYAPNGGPCYRCEGKGKQTAADQKRNYGYDLHHKPEAKPTSFAEDQESKASTHVPGTVPEHVGDYDPDDIPF